MQRSTIRGRANFRRRVKALKPEIRKAARAALAENSAEFEADVKADIPKGPDEVVAGTVRRYAVHGAYALIFRVVVGAARGTGEKGFWATFLEFGTSAMRSQPFFFYNARRKRSKYRGRLSRATAKAGRKLFNG